MKPILRVTHDDGGAMVGDTFENDFIIWDGLQIMTILGMTGQDEARFFPTSKVEPTR